MTIGLEEVGVIFAGIAVIGMLVAFITRWAKKSQRIHDNERNLGAWRDEVRELLREHRDYVDRELDKLRQDYAGDVKILHGRIDERRNELARHVEASVDVHKSLATLVEAVSAIRDRLDSIEGKIDQRR